MSNRIRAGLELAFVLASLAAILWASSYLRGEAPRAAHGTPGHDSASCRACQSQKATGETRSHVTIDPADYELLSPAPRR